MIVNKKVIAIIPARGGSKGLPGKNITKLGEKPLISWTIEAAKDTKIIDRVLVSTDCTKIAEISKKSGAEVPFLRPERLATDEASTTDVVMDVLSEIEEEFDIIVLLQPTSPCRTSLHIQEAFELFSTKNCNSLVSVCEMDKSPFWTFWRKNLKLVPVLGDTGEYTRRQDLAKSYALNGAIYIVDVKTFINNQKFYFDDTLSYVMDKQSSVDIDDIMDFQLAELILGAK